MSKSYANGIDIFGDEATLKKQIMGIKTDSKTLDEAKVADDCLVFKIFSLIAPAEEAADMRRKLEAGGFGYGDAKKQLLSVVLERYRSMRSEYQRWIKSPGELESILQKGAEKARAHAEKTMLTVKDRIGL